MQRFRDQMSSDLSSVEQCNSVIDQFKTYFEQFGLLHSLQNELNSMQICGTQNELHNYKGKSFTKHDFTEMRRLVCLKAS